MIILNKINDIKWNYSGGLLLMATQNGFIQLLDYSSNFKLQDPLMAHTSACNCISMDPTGRYFATGGSDVIFWDSLEFIPLQILEYIMLIIDIQLEK